MKDKQALEHLSVNSPVKDLVNNGNIMAICLSAMEAQAVAFVEWREEQNCSYNNQTGLWYIFGVDTKCYTTNALYRLFNQTN